MPTTLLHVRVRYAVLPEGVLVLKIPLKKGHILAPLLGALFWGPEPGWPVPVLYLSSIKPVSMDMGLVQYRYWPEVLRTPLKRCQKGVKKWSKSGQKRAIFGPYLGTILSQNTRSWWVKWAQKGVKKGSKKRSKKGSKTGYFRVLKSVNGAHAFWPKKWSRNDTVSAVLCAPKKRPKKIGDFDPFFGPDFDPILGPF